MSRSAFEPKAVWELAHKRLGEKSSPQAKTLRKKLSIVKQWHIIAAQSAA